MFQSQHNACLFVTVLLVGTVNVLNLTAWTFCDDPYGDDCVLTTISDTQGILCRGFFSCKESSLTSDGYIDCYGSHSCYNTIKMIAEDDISCASVNSCAQIKSQMQSGGGINCQGDSSCAGSQLMANVSWIYCEGYRSCSNSPQMIARYVFATGYLSGANTTFTNVDERSISYIFQGMGSGYNATVECMGECTIHCSVNSCNNLKIICASSRPDCTIDLDCDSADESSICTKNEDNNVVNVPLYIYAHSFTSIVNGTYMSHIYDIGTNDYNATCIINAGSYRDYVYDAMNISVTNGSICATGLLYN